MLLKSHCFGHLEHVSKGENKIRNTQMVSFVNHERFHGLLIIAPQSSHLFLHIVKVGNYSEEGFRVYEQDVLINKCFVGLIRQREEPSVHADETFNQRRFLFLLDETRHSFEDSCSPKGVTSQVYLL